MRIRALMLVTLAPFLTNCPTCCYPPQERFAVRTEVSVASLNELLARLGPDADERRLTCEDLCSEVYRGERGWYLHELESCSHRFTTPEERALGAAAASISCRGVGIEYYCKGRRPLGHVERDAFAGDELGAYLARCAHLEAASVLAFTELAEQLAGLGAPAQFVTRCRVAAVEEQRHAQILATFATRRGAEVPAPIRRECDVSPATIAAHNAVEGCVHEAWAAVGAAWTAVRARDPELRAAYASIAADEAGHAQLAWDLHAWLIGQLDAEARARALAGQRAAIEALPRIAAAEVAPPALGLPGPDVLAAMASRFAASLAA
jgi:hypothetical protein